MDRGEIVPRRAIWMIIQWRGLRHGFLNLYIANHESAQVNFWSQIVDAMPGSNAWCVVSDFNMIETLEDRQGSNHITLHGTKFIL